MIAIVIFFFILYYLYLGTQNIDKPSKRILILFSGYWCFSLIGVTSGLFGLYIPSLYTIFLLFLLVVGFTIGFLRKKIVAPDQSFALNVRMSCQEIGNKKWMYAIIVLTSIYIYTKLIIFRDALLLYGGSAMIREKFFDGTLYGSEFPYVNFFLTVLFVYLSPLLFYQLFNKKYVSSILIATFLFGYTVISVSRIGYLRFGIAFIMLEFIFNIDNFSKKSKMLITLGFFALMFIPIVLTSGARSNGIEDNVYESGKDEAMQNIAEYSCGPIAAFDYGIKNYYVEKSNGPHLGRMTAESADLLLEFVCRHIFNITYKPAIYNFGFKQNTSIQIGPSRSWNALYTAAMFFYLDYGIFGIFFIPLIFGYCFRSVIEKLYIRPDYGIMVVVFMFFRGTIFSVVDMDFTDPFVFVLLVYLLWRWNKKYRVNNFHQ